MKRSTKIKTVLAMTGIAALVIFAASVLLVLVIQSYQQLKANSHSCRDLLIVLAPCVIVGWGVWSILWMGRRK